MNPREKYGDEFYYGSFEGPRKDGGKLHCHDIVVCIQPKENPSETLDYAWSILRELAHWVSEEFKDASSEDTYRIVIGWSKSVRRQQGHIVKVWNDLQGIRAVAACSSPEECAAKFGQGWTPFANWQKDVFSEKARVSVRRASHHRL